MFIGTLAIAGIPPLAGFFSKDEILWRAWSTSGGAFRALWVIGFATALMTSFYMFRLIYLTFFGKARMTDEVEHHVHESPKSMTFPLVVLALCAVFAGFLGVPKSLGGTNRVREVPGTSVLGRAGSGFDPPSRARKAREGWGTHRTVAHKE